MARCLRTDEKADVALSRAAEEVERILAGNPAAKKKK
jgi:hypothetical protein